jgi:hypothetical protein
MANMAAMLNGLAMPPSEETAFCTWLELKDAVKFLDDNTRSDEFVVYATGQHIFMHAVVAASSSVNSPDIEDLMSWNFNATSTWSVDFTFSTPTKISISPPLDATGCKTLEGLEQLIFSRHFEGRSGSKHYYEVSQKFVQVSCLHFLAERT